MELVATIWDATKCLCNCTSKHAAFICYLEENLQSLAEEWTQLQNIRHDVNTRVQHAERMAHMRRTAEVEGWLKDVNSMEQIIEDIQQRSAKAVQNKCLGKFCQKNCLSSYNLGKRVVKTLDAVKKLMDRRTKIVNVAHDVPDEPVNEMPVPKTVGMDLMLNKVWDSIEDKNVGTIGLYGMGGSGKTTLMKKLNNKLANSRHNFALVIWVVVSKERDINKIMNQIRQKCGIADANWDKKSEDEKVNKIYSVMKHKKFILLLDDIWKELDLNSVGVPPPNETNQSKVLFTTRSENVCNQMHAKKFKVECLTKDEALDLFCLKVDDKALLSRPDIRVLAEELVQECKGLPLALITIGRAMAGRRNPHAWKHAITYLQSCPSEVLDMEEEVFFTLKFSYDHLPNDIDKKCFLYCALYPEDEEIYVPDLIRLWIGEGFLDEHDSIHDAYNHSEDIVEGLKLACLLESGEDNLIIKMHDVIRDMALWLARDQDQNKNKILVQHEALGSSQANNLEKWRTTEMISMMLHNFKASIWHVPICPQLVTLIVNMEKLYINDFVNIQFMSRLRVLKLSRICGIFKLPIEIGRLIQLEYLELSGLHIKERFPMEMKNLKNLKVFIMEFVQFSLEIPLEVISSLQRLRVLSFLDEEVYEDKSLSEKMKSLLLIAIHSRHTVEKSFLEQLELLPLLQELNITLETTTGINKLLNSTKLQHCARQVRLQQYGTAAINIPIMANMEHLEIITLFGLQGSVED